MRRVPDGREGRSPWTRSSAASGGLLIMNADDWGRDPETTDKTLVCTRRRAVSAVSAMVFMEDSDRAALIARDHGIDVGLHLNLTTPFSSARCSERLRERQQRLARHLQRHRLSPVVFHPGLARTFRDVVAAQLDEFRRLYEAEPDRVDGHHHMHLCANVVLAGLLPAGSLVRRSFSFAFGEKSLGNVLYRRCVDWLLLRRHRLVDFFFSLPPLECGRLERVSMLARQFVVEVETHPIHDDEYRFLTEGHVFRWADGVRIGPPSAMASRGPGAPAARR